MFIFGHLTPCFLDRENIWVTIEDSVNRKGRSCDQETHDIDESAVEYPTCLGNGDQRPGHAARSISRAIYLGRCGGKSRHVNTQRRLDVVSTESREWLA